MALQITLSQSLIFLFNAIASIRLQKYFNNIEIFYQDGLDLVCLYNQPIGYYKLRIIGVNYIKWIAQTSPPTLTIPIQKTSLNSHKPTSCHLMKILRNSKLRLTKLYKIHSARTMTSRNKQNPSKIKASKAQNPASVTMMTKLTNSLKSQKTRKPMMRLLSFSKKIFAFNLKTKR